MFFKILKYCIAILLVSVFVFYSCKEDEIPEEETKLNRCDSVASFISYCDSLDAQGIKNDYQFPIIPGMPEWVQLTMEQRDSVSQVPENILSEMCTHDLIETCFNYPFFLSTSFCDHFSSFWYHFIDLKNFNGIYELVSRCDAPQKLLAEYLEFDAYPYADSITNVKYKMHIQKKSEFLELFLVHENVITNLNNEELIALGNKAKVTFQVRNENLNIEFSISPTYSCYVLGRMMYFGNYEPCLKEIETNDQLKNFIITGSCVFYYNESWKFIMNNIDSYLTKLQTDEN